jgi:hypothetical protein
MSQPIFSNNPDVVVLDCAVQLSLQHATVTSPPDDILKQCDIILLDGDVRIHGRIAHRQAVSILRLQMHHMLVALA